MYIVMKKIKDTK